MPAHDMVMEVRASSSEERVSKPNRRMLLSCFLGTIIEWYDFLIYGFLAPIAFHKLFFPEVSSLDTLHLDRETLLAGVVIGNVIGIGANPFFGALSDRVGRRPLLALASTLAALYVVFLFFPLLETGNTGAILLAMAIPGAILQPMSLAVSGSFYPELFGDARLSLSGVSLGRQLGTVLGGGLMPMIATSLLALGGGSLVWAVSYVVLISGLACLAVLSARETIGAKLS